MPYCFFSTVSRCLAAPNLASRNLHPVDSNHIANYTAINTVVTYLCSSSTRQSYLETDRTKTSIAMTCNASGVYEEEEVDPNCVESESDVCISYLDDKIKINLILQLYFVVIPLRRQTLQVLQFSSSETTRMNMRQRFSEKYLIYVFFSFSLHIHALSY